MFMHICVTCFILARRSDFIDHKCVVCAEGPIVGVVRFIVSRKEKRKRILKII